MIAHLFWQWLPECSTWVSRGTANACIDWMVVSHWVSVAW